MSEDDLKTILAKYQQKSFELFNQNIVLETQVENLQKKVNVLQQEIEKSKPKRTTKASSDDF
jgi:uncharacterized small protein (DUF1192 family)